MDNLSINSQHSSTSRSGESSGTGTWLFYENPLNIKNSPDSAQSWRDEEISQLNPTLRKMENEIIKLRRGDDLNMRSLHPS